MKNGFNWLKQSLRAGRSVPPVFFLWMKKTEPRQTDDFITDFTSHAAKGEKLWKDYTGFFITERIEETLREARSKGGSFL